MNAHGSAIEGRLGRPIMSSLHAGWSFGGFSGAAGVAGATAAGIDPRLQNTLAAGLLLLGLLACLTSLGPGSATAAGERFRLPSRAVVLMAVLCFLTMVTEGAMADWGGVYLRGDLGASAGVAAAAFAAFAAGMTIARLTGDWINQQIGPTRLLRGGSALAAIALGTMLVIAHPIAALAGLVLVGIGVANGVPLLFSFAGAGGVETAGPSIAAVSSMGSLGFLVGPPFIGFLAEATSLPFALTSLCLATAAVAVLAPRVHRQGLGPAGAGARDHVRFAAILSDLDGVLVDSGDAVEAVWRDWAAGLGLDPGEVVRAMHGVPSREVIATVAPHLDAAAEAQRVDALHAETGGEALPGAAELLAAAPPEALGRRDLLRLSARRGAVARPPACPSPRSSSPPTPSAAASPPPTPTSWRRRRSAPSPATAWSSRTPRPASAPAERPG